MVELSSYVRTLITQKLFVLVMQILPAYLRVFGTFYRLAKKIDKEDFHMKLALLSTSKQQFKKSPYYVRQKC